MAARAIIFNGSDCYLMPKSSSSSYRPNICCSVPCPSFASSNSNKNISLIQTSGVIGCLRAPSAELALGVAHAALNSGISVLEVVVSCPDVFEVIQELVREHPTKTIGVGTVLNVEDAKCAIQYGAEFLMRPAMVQEVFDVVQGTEVLYIPGVMTPTEILFAYNAGAKVVRVYPVSAIGGAQYIRAVRKSFPNIPIVTSQGITLGRERINSRLHCWRSISCYPIRCHIRQEDCIPRGLENDLQTRKSCNIVGK